MQQQPEQTPEEQYQSESNVLDLSLVHKMDMLREQVTASHGPEKAEIFISLLMARFGEAKENGTLLTLDDDAMNDLLDILDMDL
ncbi:hypothetical protein MKQ70_22980 [Chitinophaga sedimenti]|uniref:hypothetical protein n=1 Tax=Chitinophaga sedimenti TaxID=2033606 RepID=UPI002002F46D|nr:hypothetical protein [Chitinophaga sedimenti]MCK7557713.1 hypothetical protein [Chitinophaga sedimenti]